MYVCTVCGGIVYMHNVQGAVTREQWHCSVCRLVGVHSVQCTVQRAQVAEDSELNRLLKRGSLWHWLAWLPLIHIARLICKWNLGLKLSVLVRFIFIKGQLKERIKSRREVINKAGPKFSSSPPMRRQIGQILGTNTRATRVRKLQEIGKSSSKLAETADPYRKLISVS